MHETFLIFALETIEKKLTILLGKDADWFSLIEFPCIRAQISHAKFANDGYLTSFKR